MKFKIPKSVRNMINIFEKSGFEIYIVGGAVRNLLMGKNAGDWDLTTNATPEQILKLFPNAFYDNKFGTVGLADEISGKPKEITTFRTEHGYSDRRRPDKVLWGKSLEEDLSRRDFTINAIALQISSSENHKIIDPYAGQEDIKKKIIRAVGNPVERFAEDALRMMRALRIAAELGFQIEEKTFEAIKMHAKTINLVSKERVRDELLKIMASPYPYEGIVILNNSGLMQQILPEVTASFNVEQKSPGRHHIYDVGTHLLMSLKNCPSTDPVVRFATLLHDIGKPAVTKVQNGVITFYNHEVVGARMAKDITRRLKFSKKDGEKIWTLVRQHQFTVGEQQTDQAIRRFIRKVGRDNLQDILDLRVGDRLGGGAAQTSWRLEEFKKRLVEVQKQPFSIADLKVNGNDVMKILKIKPGPKVGVVLNKLFEEVEEDISKNTRGYLLKRITEL